MPDLHERYERQHLAQIKALNKQIQQIYNTAIVNISFTASSVPPKTSKFALSAFPLLRNKIDGEIKKMEKSLGKTLADSLKKSWRLSNKKNDELVDRRLAGKKPSAKGRQILYDPNLGAFNQFIARKEKGLNLSQRVFKTVEPFKKEMEQYVGLSIGEGKSATKMASELKQYLQNPDALYRRVTGEDGKLKLSQAAQNYNPGRGVYRSSYKNAFRLARTENNMAYRTADFERWNKLPFIKGIEVRLSKNHPKYDICFTNWKYRVHTSKGLVPIARVKVGDLVLSHEGKFRKVLQTFRTPTKREEMTEIQGMFSYDKGRGGAYKISATNNHPFLVGEKWVPISEIRSGDKVKMLAGKCASCGTVVPYDRAFCSRSCSSRITATNQHKNPLHTAKLSKKRKTLIEQNNGRMPWFESYHQTGRHKLNLTRTPERIAKQKEGMRRLAESGNHPFQQEENRKKGASVLGRDKYSSFIERKVKWLLEQKNIPYHHNFAFRRKEKFANGSHRQYFIDFVLKDHKIAIEVDGEYWHTDKGKDKARQSEIEAEGYVVLRFTGEQVRKRLHECSAEIDRVLANHNDEYEFMDFEIVNVRPWIEEKRKAITKYNLQVDVDNSYIVNGFVVHNCDEVKGLYPKDFLFRLWHPQCLCYAVPVLMDDAEYDQLEDKILAGESIPDSARGSIKRTPDGFNKFVRENKGRIAGWKSTPYWVKDNPEYYKQASNSRRLKSEPKPAKPGGEAIGKQFSQIDGAIRGQARRAFRAIDSVHGDGVLKDIPFISRHTNAYEASFSHLQNGSPYRIELSTKATDPELSLVHEMGHYLDLHAIGKKGLFNSHIKGSPVSKVVSEARQSSAIKDLQKTLDDEAVVNENGVINMSGRKIQHLEYLLSDHEIWARAYTQYIATKTQNVKLLDGIKRRNERKRTSGIAYQWTEDDFKGIEVAIDAMMEGLKWRVSR